MCRSMRPIRSAALRDVLRPGPKPGGGDANHAVDIKAILSAYKIDHAEQVAQAWLSMSGKVAETALHRSSCGHRLRLPDQVEKLHSWSARC